jgi:hypothetical protein
MPGLRERNPVLTNADQRNLYRQGTAKGFCALAQGAKWATLAKGGCLLPKPKVEGSSPFARSIQRSFTASSSRRAIQM